MPSVCLASASFDNRHPVQASQNASYCYSYLVLYAFLLYRAHLSNHTGARQACWSHRTAVGWRRTWRAAAGPSPPPSAWRRRQGSPARRRPPSGCVRAAQTQKQNFCCFCKRLVVRSKADCKRTQWLVPLVYWASAKIAAQVPYLGCCVLPAPDTCRCWWLYGCWLVRGWWACFPCTT